MPRPSQQTPEQAAAEARALKDRLRKADEEDSLLFWQQVTENEQDREEHDTGQDGHD